MASVDVLSFFKEFGFAAFVAGFVLVRLQPAIDTLKTTIETSNSKLQKTITLLSIVIAKTNGLDYEEIRRNYTCNGDDANG